MALSAVVTSSANTKSAEARSVAFGTPSDAVEAAEAAEAAGALAAPSSPRVADAERSTSTTALRAQPREVITPPPADLRLENPKLRRLQKDEVTPALLTLANTIVHKHYAKPVGTQIETEIEGKRVIARIERHFHPEGGAVKPWGYHPGVSLFVAR